jgi:hypothetical protein
MSVKLLYGGVMKMIRHITRSNINIRQMIMASRLLFHLIMVLILKVVSALQIFLSCSGLIL